MMVQGRCTSGLFSFLWHNIKISIGNGLPFINLQMDTARVSDRMFPKQNSLNTKPENEMHAN